MSGTRPQAVIDAAGLHIPTYNEIKANLLLEARAIYGPDIYLEHDGQDYEFICLIADRIHDCFLAVQMVYNNRSPHTAIGAALDGLVKLNGIRRKSATPSRCVVTLTGNARTEIINGVVADDTGTNWLLPTPLQFPGETGVIELEAMAVCTKVGALTAPPGTVTRIITPTDGWLAVTNYEAAAPGQEVEGQEYLRARQAISTARPSRTVLEGLIGGIAEIPDVTRYRVYENDTNIFGYYGPPIPGHSICAVVEGGENDLVGLEIYLRKTPGCGTYGDVKVDIAQGNVVTVLVITPIYFFQPRYFDMHVTVTVKKLAGYTQAVNEGIRQNVTDYLNSIVIGDPLIISGLWAAAASAAASQTRPSFSITNVTVGLKDEDQSADDYDIPFNAVTRGFIENVTVEYA